MKAPKKVITVVVLAGLILFAAIIGIVRFLYTKIDRRIVINDDTLLGLGTAHDMYADEYNDYIKENATSPLEPNQI